MRADVKAIRPDFPVRAVVIFKVTDIFDVEGSPERWQEDSLKSDPPFFYQDKPSRKKG
jgi:hypothetical protein